MKFEAGIDKKYRDSIEEALSAIIEKGNDFHRMMINNLLDSDMQVRVKPVRQINASGVTGLINPVMTNIRMTRTRMNLRDALGEVCIAIAEETIDTGGQRGCEGTFVHEGRHAYDFAQTIESLSNADINPIGIFNPSLYELEWEAHKTAGDYMICINEQEYIDEGLQLMILGLGLDGECFVNDDGIRQRLNDSYGLSLTGTQGRLATQMMGIVV
ncbi:MAG: hypothetical protein ABIV21_07250 [Pyrinomonadaceae bacterium]